MGKIELFAVGGSAGGLEAIRKIASRLPVDFPAAVCVVIHVSAESPGLIPDILSASGALPARHAEHGEPVVHGRIFVAPPDQHLVIDKERRLRLGRGPKENRFRPAVDPLFRSAALAFDGCSAGIVLSGGLDDGAAGLATIKRHGGGALVQDPSDAPVSSMPRAALRAVKPDQLLPASRLADAMQAMAREYRPSQRQESGMSDDDLQKETLFALGADCSMEDLARLGAPSLFTCPECHGAMIRLKEAGPIRFRCHTGHAFTLQSLLSEQADRVEELLWTTLRAMEEERALLQHLGEHLQDSQDKAQVMRVVEEAHRRANVIRELAQEQVALARTA